MPQYRGGPYAGDTYQDVVRMHLDGMSNRAISRTFCCGHPSRTTIDNMVAHYKETIALGIVEPNTVPKDYLTGRKGKRNTRRKNDEASCFLLSSIVLDHEDWRQTDIAAELTRQTGKVWSQSNVSKAMKEAGITRKRKFPRAAEADEEKRQVYRDYVVSCGYSSEHFVFIDETAVDGRTGNRNYGYALQGQRTRGSQSFVRGKRYTSHSAMSKSGFLHIDTFEGASTLALFTTWLVSSVLPVMNEFPFEDSVLVMDNCRIHNRAMVEFEAAQFGVQVLFLPPYSPDLNPIEKAFGKLKETIRNNPEWMDTFDAEDAIKAAFGEISQSDCQSWIEYLPFYNGDAE